MQFYNSSVKEVLDEFGSSHDGLTSAKVTRAREKYGLNQLEVKGEPLWRKLIEPFSDVFTFVLMLAVAISVISGEYIDAAIVAAIISISAIIYYVQRFSTERILRALQKKDAVKTTVIRDGKSHIIDASELVPGDVFVLTEGEKIPADARIMSSSSLRVDESQLTGESLPIGKSPEEIKGTKEIYEQANMIFQGSFVIGGEGHAIVVRTGNTTEFGRIANLSTPSSGRSPVQEKIDALIKKLVYAISAISLVTFGLALWRGIEFTESLRYVIALAVSAVPEGLPIAITVILVLGMRRMAAKQALVRTMRSIETIGTVTTIATDKTGTLTKNKLTVQHIWKFPSSKTALDTVIAHAAIHGSGKAKDPLDTALLDYTNSESHSEHKQPYKVFPFDQDAAMSGNAWHHGDSYILSLKGAPEKLIDLCELTENERESITHQVHQMAADGFRVIGFAELSTHKLPETLGKLKSSHRIQFVGLVGVADVLRTEAAEAIQKATSAGIVVRMITGDHFETAASIGKSLGIITRADQVFDSRKMHTMDDEQLIRAIRDVRVFARVIPDQKQRLLHILKQTHITAMTGDGVNDVPALTKAHVGISMGSGTEIAKDAGDIILLDDNFKSIIDAVEEGRIIFTNIRRMVLYLLSTNLGEVLVATGSLIIGLPMPLYPVQILWINLVTDTSMVIPLGLEPGGKGTMNHPPINPKAPLLNRYFISRIITVAVAMAVITLASFTYFLNTHDVEYARTVAFIVLITMQWGSAIAMRSNFTPIWKSAFRPNVPFAVGMIVSILLQLLAFFGPLAPWLHVTPIDMPHFIIMSIIPVIFIILVIETHKFIGVLLDHHKK